MPHNNVIFWDFDGTLGYRPEGWAGAMAALVSEHDPDSAITEQDLRPFLREGFPWHSPETPHPELCDPDRYWRHLRPIFVRAYTRNGVNSQVAEQLATRMRPRLSDSLTYVLYEDSLPTLSTLHEMGWRHVLLTNNIPELPKVLDELGLLRLFEHVINSGSIGYEKPHPEIFRLALGAAGNPTHAWMVGDNYVADVLGAERAGIEGLLVRKQDPRARWNCADLSEAMSTIIEDSKERRQDHP